MSLVYGHKKSNPFYFFSPLCRAHGIRSLGHGEKEDIYQLGVVLLEIITGKPAGSQSELDSLRVQVFGFHFHWCHYNIEDTIVGALACLPLDHFIRYMFIPQANLPSTLFWILEMNKFHAFHIKSTSFSVTTTVSTEHHLQRI